MCHKKKNDMLKIPTYEVTSVENVGKLFIYNIYSPSVVLILWIALVLYKVCELAGVMDKVCFQAV